MNIFCFREFNSIRIFIHISSPRFIFSSVTPSCHLLVFFQHKYLNTWIIFCFRAKAISQLQSSCIFRYLGIYIFFICCSVIHVNTLSLCIYLNTWIYFFLFSCWRYNSTRTLLFIFPSPRSIFYLWLPLTHFPPL